MFRKIVDETVSKWGQLDILVNNASFQGKSVEKFEDIDRARLEFTFHSNILNYFSTSQAAVKHMKEGAVIININSIQGYNPSPGVLDYSTTKVYRNFCCVPVQEMGFCMSHACVWHRACVQCFKLTCMPGLHVQQSSHSGLGGGGANTALQ